MRRRVRAGIAATLLAATALAAAPEYQVKAQFLYNFAKYVEWPVAAKPFRVCVIGEDPFGRLLDDAVAGRTVGTRPIVVARPFRLFDMTTCDVAFVSASEQTELVRLLPALEAAGVLTVGETDEFARHGGMITFRLHERKVRFEINAAAAERAGLRMSSQLLKLATRVVQ